jgi:hypothetical protein
MSGQLPQIVVLLSSIFSLSPMVLLSELETSDAVKEFVLVCVIVLLADFLLRFLALAMRPIKAKGRRTALILQKRAKTKLLVTVRGTKTRKFRSKHVGPVVKASLRNEHLLLFIMSMAGV